MTEINAARTSLEDVEEALKDVIDPELGVNIVDLGLLYGLKYSDDDGANALNLDTFEIDLAPESGGGPEVTIGQQLGQNLFVRVQQGVGEQSSTNFILEYELTDWLRLQTNVIQGSSTQQSLFRRAQSTGADLIFFFSY